MVPSRSSAPRGSWTGRVRRAGIVVPTFCRDLGRRPSRGDEVVDHRRGARCRHREAHLVGRQIRHGHSYPASNLITRRTLESEPAQPGLLADLDNGHYFPAVAPPAHDDVATLKEFVQAADRTTALEMVDDDAVWREAETLPWGGEWRGPDGFARLTREIDTFAEFTVRGQEIVQAGEVVELRLDAVFTSRKSGRRLPMKVVEHYRVREGKIYGADAFYKDTQAVNDLVKHG
jgi:ketosteroid isomerase-like protein